jgi:hypothetical protein
MSKTWKWILGTVVVLVVVAALGFLAWNAYGSVRWSGRVLTGERVRPPMMEGFERGDRGDWKSPCRSCSSAAFSGWSSRWACWRLWPTSLTGRG